MYKKSIFLLEGHHPSSMHLSFSLKLLFSISPLIPPLLLHFSSLVWVSTSINGSHFTMNICGKHLQICCFCATMKHQSSTAVMGFMHSWVVKPSAAMQLLWMVDWDLLKDYNMWLLSKQFQSWLFLCYYLIWLGPPR